MKVAWNLKGGGISGFTLSEDEVQSLHDVYSAAANVSSAKKAKYILKLFLWRDLTSSYDLIGPYFPVENSIDSNTLQELFVITLKALSSYGFRVSIVLCDGASSNLTLLKMLCGYPKAALETNTTASDLQSRYKVNASFINPEDRHGNPIFVMICPSHQVRIIVEGKVMTMSLYCFFFSCKGV